MNIPDESHELFPPDEVEQDSSLLALDAVLTREQPADETEITIQTGEYEEDEAGESIEIPISSTTLPENLNLSEKLRQIIEKRLAIYREFEELDKDRRELLGRENLSEEVRTELRRQRNELQRLPSGQDAREALNRMGRKLTEIAGKVKAGKCPALDPDLVHAQQLASRQWKLCMTRGTILSGLEEATAELVAKEPLLIILKRFGLESGLLFAWAAYATAIEAETTVAVKKRRGIQEQLAEIKSRKHGFLARLHRADQEKEEALRKLEQSEAFYTDRISYLTREQAAIAPLMVKEFWRIYREAAPFILHREITGPDAVILRAFFRYGMISREDWLLEPEVAEHILADCAPDAPDVDYSTGAMNVLYADEYIRLIADGSYTPSIDEDLELNHRNSPAWHADRLHRRLLSTVYRETAYNEVLVNLSEAIGELHEKQSLLEAEASNLVRTAPDYGKAKANLKQQIQNCKVNLGRFERIKKRVEEQFLPQQVEIREQTEEKIANLEFKITPDYLAGREAAAMHRMSRLCAKLQDPFPPFALRDNYKPGTRQVNSREEIIRELRELERRDPTIFKDCLFPVKKESQRIYLRYSPVILISPGCGFMGYAWNPRTNIEVGRLVLPAYCPRPGLRERMLHNLLADFRWDTSKASAGMDLLGSETLMAAYSTMRWEYRHKQKPVREKAAIYTEENDRQNFRRHYALYLQSAPDGGKKLFFKCREAYDALVKYIPLPPGVEKLKR